MAHMILKSGEKLVHYSRRPLQDIRDTQQEAWVSPYAKPKGLWVSVEALGYLTWRQWCLEEEYCHPATDPMGLQTEIHLTESAKIIRISDTDDMDYFSREHLCRESPRHQGGIFWKHVAKEYDGIIIAPYIGERRLHDDYSWYYTWDCASGCIWRASAIQPLSGPTTLGALEGLDLSSLAPP